MLARLRYFACSYTGRLLLGTLLIHALLVPVLFAGLLHIAAAEYQSQFVNQVRAQSYLLAALLDKTPDAPQISQLSEDLVLSGQMAYADYLSPRGEAIVSSLNPPENRFQEDFFFGEHADHIYYIAVPVRSGAGGVLRVGFSELPVEEHVSNSYHLGLALAAGYILLTLTLVGFFGRLLNQSIRRLQEASRRIAKGSIEEHLTVSTSVNEISCLAQDLELMRQMLLSREQDIALREAHQRAVLESAAEGIITVNPDCRIESFNKAAESLFDYRADQVIGTPFDRLLAPENRQKFYTPCGNPGICSRAEFAGQRRSGETCHLMLSVSEATTADSCCFTILVQDIGERLAYEARLAHMATHDSLTGLPNRALYADRLDQVLAHAARDGHIVALLFLDLDRFKIVNDSLGHHVGDELLQAAARRLQGCLRKEDTLARLGGDEFTLILPHLERADNAARVAENILRALEQPFRIAGRELFISCSIGIASYPCDGREAIELSKNADSAMYATKNRGGRGYQFYSKQMNDKSVSRLELDTQLRHALERGELLLHYQPQVDAREQRVVGVEALLRWRHPELGMVSPAEFIPLAEETGVIIPISEWVLRTACRQGRAWQDQGLAVTVAVNLSACHFTQPDLVETVQATLAETGLEPALLDLEVTESTVMGHGEETIAILQGLKRLGVALSLDDFGTGYSSLSYLQRFPIDTLKIDRSFIQDIFANSDGGTLAATIIAMARSLRLQVIAEGVETAQQLAYLQAQGCDTCQGFYFSKPVPSEEATALLRGKLRPGAHAADGPQAPALGDVPEWATRPATQS